MFYVNLLREDTGKSCEQYIPYLLGQTMLMTRSILFYNLLDSINASILTKAACSNIENRAEKKLTVY